MSGNNVKENGFQGLLNRALSVFNKGKDEVVRSSKVSKARLDLSSLKNEKEHLFKRLGEEVYRRHKENKISIPGLDSFFTEIDIISLKLASKERELKALKGEEAALIPADAVRGHEGKGRPKNPKTKGSPYAQTTASPAISEEGRPEGSESDRRPKKKHYRPRRRPSEGRQDVDQGRT
ncbi:MAG: hypothetical protein AAB275_08345 [Deltaproteobacteria bacterium]